MLVRADAEGQAIIEILGHSGNCDLTAASGAEVGILSSIQHRQDRGIAEDMDSGSVRSDSEGTNFLAAPQPLAGEAFVIGFGAMNMLLSFKNSMFFDEFITEDHQVQQACSRRINGKESSNSHC